MIKRPTFKAEERPDIKNEESARQGSRVMKLETPTAPEVSSFQLPKIKRAGEGEYATVKARFGALAATDSDRKAKERKDSRFALNPLLRDPLSIEQEEKRVIEEKVRTRVQSVSEEAKTRAAQEGYQEGLKQGYAEAFKKFQEEGADRIRRFDAFIQECEGAKEAIFRANERFLIELVFRISRMILLRELKTDRDLVLRLASEILERVGVRENITLRVSADDVASAAMLKEGLEKSLGALKNLNIEGSPLVQAGGCMVETEWNAIDASVETQLKGLYQGLVGESGA